MSRHARHAFCFLLGIFGERCGDGGGVAIVIVPAKVCGAPPLHSARVPAAPSKLRAGDGPLVGGLVAQLCSIFRRGLTALAGARLENVFELNVAGLAAATNQISLGNARPPVSW